MKKSIHKSYEDIWFPISDDFPWIADLGCGFTLFLFNENVDYSKVKDFLRSSIVSSIYYNDLTYQEYVDVYFHGVRSEDDFLANQYKQYLKVFGGNHFIEYGKDKYGRNYLLIHCGSNGIFPYLYERNKWQVKRIIECCYNYASENRKGIIKQFCRYLDIPFNEWNIWDQKHTFMLNDGLIMGYSESKDEGNIFTGGPFQKTLLIRTNEDCYIRHGVEELPYIKLFDYLRYSKEDFRNYGRSFVSLSKYDFSGFEILNTFKPKITERPRNAH